MISRRSFITGLISLVAAPAIVRAGSLMPIKQMIVLNDDIIIDSPIEFHTFIFRYALPQATWRLINQDVIQ